MVGCELLWTYIPVQIHPQQCLLAHHNDWHFLEKERMPCFIDVKMDDGEAGPVVWCTACCSGFGCCSNNAAEKETGAVFSTLCNRTLHHTIHCGGLVVKVAYVLLFPGASDISPFVS